MIMLYMTKAIIRQTQTHTGPIALLGPLKWLVKGTPSIQM